MSAAGLTAADLRARAGKLASSTTGTSRVWALTLVLVSVGVVLAAIEWPAGRPADSPPGISVPWWLLAAIFYVTEAKVVHLHIGRSAHSFSMSELPVVYGLFFFSPAEYIVARLLGAGLALVISRRQRSVKLAFNLAQFLLCSVVTLGIVHLLDPISTTFAERDWAIAFIATSAENAVGVLAVIAAISLAEGVAQANRIPRMFLMGSVVSLTNTSLALLMITVLFDRGGVHRLSRLRLGAPAARRPGDAVRVHADPAA